MRLISRTLNQIQSPVSAAQNLMRDYRGKRALLDLSQGSPSYATAPAIAKHIAEAALAPDGGKYTTRAGFEKLRELVADDISELYSGSVTSNQILITAGCNQAFCIAVSALADVDDEVILCVPFYFNHDMWLRLERIRPVYLESGSGFSPDPDAARALISARTRAIVIVTPGNPTGVTIPRSVIDAFGELARKSNIALIIDETYKAFRAGDGAAHGLFSRTDWPQHVVSLHSFSKEFAIPGHRVGAVVGDSALIVEMMKFFDCISICAPRLGQEAMIEALTNCKEWRRSRAAELRQKEARFRVAFASRPGGFELCSAGAFFGWVRHPRGAGTTEQVVLQLLQECGILVLPGTIFTPSDGSYLRFSFGGLSIGEIDELGERLCEFS